MGFNSEIGDGFVSGFGVGFKLDAGFTLVLALVLDLVLSFCDKMVGFGLVRRVIWEAVIKRGCERETCQMVGLVLVAFCEPL